MEQPKIISNFVAEMNKFTLFIIANAIFCHIAIAQNINSIAFSNPSEAPLHEIRAVWLATIGGIDWPHTYAYNGYGIQNQQKELCDILDNLCDAGINTVLLQTRVRGTSIFPSNMEPWDPCLSGKPGVSPGYDALEFAIAECHKRGMKIHAWIVTIPVGKWNGVGCLNLRRKHPELLRKIGEEGFMNPEKDGTSAYLARYCQLIVEKYDIDGIHLDYIRYPDSWKKISNKKLAQNNITNIVTKIHGSIKSIKPWVVVSCSPVGKYADTKRAWSHGWNARDVVCQDAIKWLDMGIMDVLFPMMYFRDKDFYPFLADWQERSNGKIIVPGLGIYFLHQNEKNWPLIEISREMNVSRLLGMGTCMFRSKFLTDNTKHILNYTKNSYSTQPSLQPSLLWLKNKLPQSPHELQLVKLKDGENILKWETPNYAAEEGGVQYNIYGSACPDINTADAANLLATNYTGNTIRLPQTHKIKYFAVTTTDRYGNESHPALMNKSNNEIKKYSCDYFLQADKQFVYLNNTDIDNTQLIELHSNIGTLITSRFVYKINDSYVADISTLPPGHYKVYSVNKKEEKHLLGRFFISPSFN